MRRRGRLDRVALTGYAGFVAGPFSVTLCPNTSQGRMVGDYISTSWVGGKAFGAFAVAKTASGGFAFDQAISVPAGGLNGKANPDDPRLVRRATVALAQVARR